MHKAEGRDKETAERRRVPATDHMSETLIVDNARKDVSLDRNAVDSAVELLSAIVLVT